MRKLLSLLSLFAIVLSCSSDETSTPVTPPPAPIVKYTITLSAGEGGTVSTTGGEYEAGQTVSVTATPQGEYVFTSWSDGNTNATRTITISSNSTITANFEKRKYPLTINFEGEGEVLEEIVNAGRTTEYDSGTTVKLTAQAAAEWVFMGWEGALNGTSNPQQLLISEPQEVTATFEKKKYPLTVSIEGEGEVLEEIVNASRTTDYDSGTTVKLTAQPTDEWLFTGWSGDIGDIDPTENPIQLNIIESKTVTATFEKKKYPLTVNIEGEGEVLEEIVNTGRTTDYDSGTTVKLTAVPDEGWEFVGWTGAIESEELEVQLLVVEAKEVVGEFKRRILAEKYSALNEKSGKILKQKFQEGIYAKKDYEDFSDLRVPAYWIESKSIIQYDFFNDGNVDLFGFAPFDRESQEGKYVLIEDVNTINRKPPIYYNAKVSSGGETVLADINNDGKLEILHGGENAHGFYNGGPNFLMPLQVITLNSNRTIDIKSVGPDIALHNLDSGDIDSDGDIDIVLWPGPTRAEYQEITFPIKLINNGNGDFSQSPLLVENDSLVNNHKSWTALNYNLIDLNNDGFLDILGGHYIGRVDNREIWFPQDRIDHISLRESDPYIIWGNGKDFSLKHMTLLQDGVYEDKLMQFYGATPTDYDNDGDLDIITVGYIKTDESPTILDESNYVIQLYENIGNETFIHVTKDKIEGYEDLSGSVFSNFYTPIIKDVDLDGDFDIVATALNYHRQGIQWPKYLMWENVGGRFIRKYVY